MRRRLGARRSQVHRARSQGLCRRGGQLLHRNAAPLFAAGAAALLQAAVRPDLAQACRVVLRLLSVMRRRRAQRLPLVVGKLAYYARRTADDQAAALEMLAL